MSKLLLPRFVSPRKLAQQGACIEGVVPVSSMQHMEDLVVDQTEEINVNLKFMIDGGYVTVTGKLFGTVLMECQRCMDTTSVDISANISLACLHADQQVKSLPPQFEPLMVTDEKVDLYALAEEELLLSLPIVAYHNNDKCNANEYSKPVMVTIDDLRKDKNANEQTQEKENPFSVLTHLKLNP
ncbi:MAG: YceD family protein [Endozoicomonadaceae bacterium]|nr:YceD family protein [Endozoicomonadaceae bacterium]